MINIGGKLISRTLDVIERPQKKTKNENFNLKYLLDYN